MRSLTLPEITFTNAVGDALDQSDRVHRCADARGEEEWEYREDHLVIRVGGEVAEPDREDVPIEPTTRARSGHAVRRRLVGTLRARCLRIRSERRRFARSSSARRAF